jgi:pilus assembly protein Flp/PilA
VRKFTARRHKGQGLVEYGLVLVLIAVIVAVALLLVGNQAVTMYSNVISTIAPFIP